MAAVFVRDMAAPSSPSPDHTSEQHDPCPPSSLVFRPQPPHPADRPAAASNSPPPASSPLPLPISAARVPFSPDVLSARPELSSQVSHTSNISSTSTPPPAPSSGLSNFLRRGSIFPTQANPKSQAKRMPDIEPPQSPVVAREDKAKEELAMAKWRQWIIEQPIQPIESPLSPNPAYASRKTSPAHMSIPMVPFTSPRSPAASPLTGRSKPRRADSGESSQQSGVFSRSHTSSIPQGEFDFYNTESVRALRDVELAVDGDMLARAAAKAQMQSRRLSTMARVTDSEENPFVDLAPRLGSRRVRPIVLELIQALGHYIDAIWCLTYPETPCPWVFQTAGPLRASNGLAILEESDEVWRSQTLTAVKNGKALGHVPHPPTQLDVDFWQAEVIHSIRDVDEVVGVTKGNRGQGFRTFMARGRYGEIAADNVIIMNAPGRLARLLNDLEEALWGDAPPRSTDLAYDLPLDFDPYAIVDPDDVVYAPVRRPDLLSHSVDQGAPPTSPVHLPDLPDPTVKAEERKHKSWDGQIRTEETLEEIGRRRHREWLESKRNGGGW